MKKKIILSIVAFGFVAIFGALAFAMSKKPSIVKHGVRCKEGQMLTLEIGGTSIKVPRNKWQQSTALRVENGTKFSGINFEKKNLPCSKNLLNNVVHYYNIKMSLGLQGKTGNSTTYESYKNEIDVAYKNGKVEKLNNGIEKLIIPASVGNGERRQIVGNKTEEIFILPKKLAPTGNDDPVAFKCNTTDSKDSFGEYCSVRYKSKHGVYVYRKYSEHVIGENKHLEVYQELEDRLSKMVINKNEQGEK